MFINVPGVLLPMLMPVRLTGGSSFELKSLKPLVVLFLYWKTRTGIFFISLATKVLEIENRMRGLFCRKFCALQNRCLPFLSYLWGFRLYNASKYLAVMNECDLSKLNFFTRKWILKPSLRIQLFMMDTLYVFEWIRTCICVSCI